MLVSYCDRLVKKEPIGNVMAAVLTQTVPDYGQAGEGKVFKYEPINVIYKDLIPGLHPQHSIRVALCDALGRELVYPGRQEQEPEVVLHFKRRTQD